MTSSPFLRTAGCLVGVWLGLAGQADTLNGLVGFWPLDEGSGNILDELSGHSSAGLVSDHDLVWVQDNGQACLRFDQARQKEITLPSSPAWDYAEAQEGALTICFRVKIEKPGWILDHRFGGIPGAWGFNATGRTLDFSVYLDKPWTDDRKSVNVHFGDVLEDWHHLALVWQRGKNGWLKAYRDGVEVDSAEAVPVTAAYVQPLTIGGRNSGQFGWSTGSMKELAIFNRVLSAPEIATVAKQGILLNAPLAVSLLRTDKILYSSNETARITTRVRNTSNQPQTADVSLALESLLQDSRPIATRTVTLEKGKSIVLAETTDLNGLAYGCEVKATIRQAGKTICEKRDVFQVSENIWAVGIGSAFGSALHTGLGQSGPVPQLARDRYANYFELFFWSPCDWSRHVAPAKQWWSGQACYAQDRDELASLITNAHNQGIKVAMYASCNPAGPFAWETARQHPDWFMDTRRRLPSIEPNLVEQLDRWNEPDFRKTHDNPPWVVVHPDLRRLEVVDYGIDRIADSIDAYAWDAVRFDGHYTVRGFDELSARNMRRLKERLWARHPKFQFGYNYGRAPEWRDGVTHEMREGMAGGGLYLQEGIRRFRYTADTYTNWPHYATNELRIAKLIQGLGGHYHCMWEVGNHPPPVAYYKFIYGLMAGGHPADFDGNVPLSPAWGSFMTRWSSLLWQRGLRPAGAIRVTVSNPSVQWRELAQEAVLGKTRKLVVIHLVNPPARDAIEGTEFPSSLPAFDVSYKAEPGTRITAARLISASGRPFDIPIPVPKEGASLNVTVPGLEHWAIMAVELSGSFVPPAAPPSFTEQPDPAQVELALKHAVSSRIIDPNKDEETVTATNSPSGGVVYETNTGSSGVPAQPVADPTAGDGVAQIMSYAQMSVGHSQHFMGRSWLTMLQPGKYNVSYRIRWTGEEPDQFWKALLYVTVPGQEDGKERTFRTQIASPNCWLAEKGNDFLGQPGAYQKMEPAGPYHYYTVAVDVRIPTYVSACAIVDTQRDGPHRFYMDHIRIESTEAYSDRNLEKWFSVKKPGNPDAVNEAALDLLKDPDGADIDKAKLEAKPLRKPNGKTPERFLEVRGIHSRPYNVGQLLSATTVYDLPKEYRDLFAYDCVVLANFDCSFTSWQQRRILHDFVRDGGRLVVLGGLATLGQGGMKNTYIEEMLPVVLKGDDEVMACIPPLTLAGKRDTEWQGGVMAWIHDVTPRKSASILASAGDRPAALRDSFGSGVVCVFTGTTLENKEEQPDVFWKKDAWPKLLNQMTRE